MRLQHIEKVTTAKIDAQADAWGGHIPQNNSVQDRGAQAGAKGEPLNPLEMGQQEDQPEHQEAAELSTDAPPPNRGPQIP